MTLIPNKGALVYARFDARKGSRLLLTLRQANGQPGPFGALVTLKGIENYESMVDEGGVVYLSGVKENGMAQVKWGNHSGQHCQASVVLPERTADEGELLPLMAVCR